jgi:hypothetical protein
VACIPHKTLSALPPDGIILQISISLEHPSAGRNLENWPPTILRSNLSGIEGVPSRYGVFQRAGRYAGRSLYVWAFFGRAHPTTAQLTKANVELRTVELER